MKKEVGLAIFFGVGLGLFVAFLMVFQIRKIQPTETVVTPSPLVRTKEENTQSTLQISEPKPDSITSSKSVTIKGNAEKDALIVAQSPLNEQITKTTGSTFSIPFELAIGENIINVTMYPATTSARIQQRAVKVYYLDEQ